MLTRTSLLCIVLLTACRDAKPQCGPGTCPTGCCDLAGACVPGNTPTACGIGGVSCAQCPSLQICSALQSCQSTSGSGGGSATGGGSGGTGGATGGAGGGSSSSCERAQSAFLAYCDSDAATVRAKCDALEAGPCASKVRDLVTCVFMNGSGITCSAATFLNSSACSNQYALLSTCAGGFGGSGGAGGSGGSGGGSGTGGMGGGDTGGSGGGTQGVPELTNGQTLTVAGMQGDQTFYLLNISNSAELNITIDGGVGDVDLYVKQGFPPTTMLFDYSAESSTQSDVLNVPTPTPGAWYLMLFAYGSYHDVQLTVTW